ncbi:hypothetical protein [Methylomonas sp. MgM2]
MINIKKILARATVVLLAYSPYSSASIAGLPGIFPPGDPNFTNGANVQLFDLVGSGSYLLAASNGNAPITFNDSANNISVSSSPEHPANFLLTAQFYSDGTYIPNSGTVRISGEIPFFYGDTVIPGVYISGDLLTAQLDKFVFDADTLGFSTTMLSGFSTIFGTKESVYLSAAGLGSTLGFVSGSLVEMTDPMSVSAITTVPIPGAGWLLGSALGVFTLVRRNKLNTLGA